MHADSIGNSWMGLFIGWLVPMIIFPWLLHLMWWKGLLFEIPLPCDLMQSNSWILRLQVMGGHLVGLSFGSFGTGNEVWMMKEYNVQSSWNKSLVVSTNYSPLFTHFISMSYQNGEILGHNDDQTLLRFNNKDKLLGHRTH